MRGVLQKGLGWMLLSIWLVGLGGLQAQSWEHKYKWRDNNRYKEGLKLKKKKNVSGTLQLVSLQVYQAQWKKNAAAAGDSAVIYFHLPAASDAGIILYQTEKNYTLDEVDGSQFKTGWNRFAWSAQIINEVGIPLQELSGLAKASRDGEALYTPVCFQKPGASTSGLVLNAILKPDKDMVLNIVLSEAASNKTVKEWKDVQIASDAYYELPLPVELLTSGVKHYKLVGIEKSNAGTEFTTLREHLFHLHLDAGQ